MKGFCQLLDISNIRECITDIAWWLIDRNQKHALHININFAYNIKKHDVKLEKRSKIFEELKV